jgi:hypothetical protein
MPFFFFCIIFNIYSKEGPERVGKFIMLLYCNPHALNLLVYSMTESSHTYIIMIASLIGTEGKRNKSWLEKAVTEKWNPGRFVTYAYDTNQIVVVYNIILYGLPRHFNFFESPTRG